MHIRWTKSIIYIVFFYSVVNFIGLKNRSRKFHRSKSRLQQNKLKYVLTTKPHLKRRVFEPNRNENGEWRRLHIEELHSLYRSLNIDRMIKSRRLGWAGHVAIAKKSRSAFKILTGKPTGKSPKSGAQTYWWL